MGYVGPALKSIYEFLCKTYTITDKDVLRHRWFTISLNCEFSQSMDWDEVRPYPIPSILKSNNRELLDESMWDDENDRSPVFNMNILYKHRGEQPLFPSGQYSEEKDEVGNRVLGYDYPPEALFCEVMHTFA